MGNVYSVGQINSYIRSLFTQDFMLRNISIRGEISNLNYNRSGHIYFSLKEQNSKISCVMFAGKRARGLDHKLEDGEQVVASGSVDVYEAGGQYQLYVDRIKRDGRGELYLRFEELKERLLRMGMFDETYKRPIPEYVGTVGVVTAPTGAAVRDIIRTIRRHAPYVQIILYPSAVQGQGAAENIARGVRALQHTEADVIIVGRGGGSIEDLWAFNEEVTAQAVFDSVIPVISGVGHETDTTICDLVADLRASTPTAAAELSVAGLHRLDERMASISEDLNRLMEGEIRNTRVRVKEDQLKLAAASPERKIRDAQNRHMALSGRAEKVMNELLDRYRNRCQGNVSLLEKSMTSSLEKYRRRHVKDEALLKGLSPEGRLSQGYSFTEREDGKPVKGVSELKAGMRIRTSFSDGYALSEIGEVHGNGGE